MKKFRRAFLFCCVFLILFSCIDLNKIKAQEVLVEENSDGLQVNPGDADLRINPDDFDISNVQTAVVATADVVDFRIKKQVRNNLSLSFTASNQEKNQSNIKYGVHLFSANDEQEEILIDEKVYSESFNLSENSNLKKDIDYEAPDYLEGDFVLKLILKNENGMLLTMTRSEIFTLTGGGENVEIIKKDCFLTVEEGREEYFLSQGVDVNDNEDLFLNCEIKNNSEKDLELIPVFETFFRSTFSHEVENKLSDNQTVKIGKSEVKKIKLKIPKALSPQAYDVKVFFENDNQILLTL